MSQAEALQRLANTPPRDFVVLQGTGKRLLHHLYQACCTSKLIAVPTASDDVSRLHAIFDVALQQGLSCLTVDYIVEVCSDASLTSSDPVDAHLLDGECVSNWCSTALTRTRQRVQQGLQQGLQSLAAGGALRREGAHQTALVRIIKTLLPAGQTRSGTGLDLEDAIRLQQCIQVLEWVAQHELFKASGCGRFSSRQEWQLTVNKRRDAAQPRTTFLQDLLDSLRHLHGLAKGFHYPPASLEQAVGGLFLHGSVSAEAWRHKLAAFLYYLLDAGHKAVLPSFRQAFSISASDLAQQQAQFLLDEAALQQPGNLALDTACSILPETASKELPFKMVEMLAARGRPHVALQVLRACTRGAQANPDTVLHEARTAVCIMLECNLVTEAYLEVRQHRDRVPAERLQSDTAALIHCLADWAALASSLHRIISLPLLDFEEQALQEWLEQQLSEGSPSGDFLVLFHLQRQNIPEAVHAFAHLDPRLSKGVESREAWRAALKDLLTSAVHLLPEAQKSLIVRLNAKQAAVGLSSSPDLATQPAISLAAIIADLQRSAPPPHPIYVSGIKGSQPPLFGSLMPQQHAVEDAGSLETDAAISNQPGISLLAMPPSASQQMPDTFPGDQALQSTGGRPSAQIAGGFGIVDSWQMHPAENQGQQRDNDDDWDSLMGIEEAAKAGPKRLQKSQPRRHQQRARRR